MKSKVLTALFFIALSGTVLLLLQDFRDVYFSADDLASLHLLDRITVGELFTEPHLEAQAGNHYQPVTDTLLFAEVKLFGGKAEPYALINVLIHLANAVLLYGLAAYLFGARAALIAVILFALHPVLPPLLGHAAKAMQKEFLLFFSLLCCYCFLRFRVKGGKLLLGLSALFMALAMGSCQWFSLPLVVLLCDLVLPRCDKMPGRLRGLVHHLWLWIAFALPVIGRLTIAGELTLGGQRPSGSFLESFLTFGIAPAAASNIIPWIAAVCVIVPLVFWLATERGKYLRPLLSAALIFAAASLPVVLWTSEGLESAPRFYLPVAFLCILAGVVLSGGPSAVLRRRLEKILVPAAMLALAVCYAVTAHLLVPRCKEEGKWIASVRDQTLTLIGDKHPEDEPVLLMNLPGNETALETGEDLPFGGLPGSLGLAFSPPFTDTDLRVFPMGGDRFLDDDHLVAFMLFMWSDGVVLKYDAGKIRHLTEEEKIPGLLADYWKRFMQGKRPSLMRLETPSTQSLNQYDVTNHALRVGPDGFPLVFPLRKAGCFRAVVLTRIGATAMEYSGFKPDDIVNRREKPYISVKFDTKRLRRSVLYFNSAPAFMWVEAVSKSGEVFHRTPFLKLRLLDEE